MTTAVRLSDFGPYSFRASHDVFVSALGTISLRIFFAVTAAFAVYCALTARTWHSHKAAVDAIRSQGGTFAVKYDGPKWLRSFFASNSESEVHKYFYNLTRVNFGKRNCGIENLEAMVKHMNAFSNFHILSLSNSAITDDGLRTLSEFRYIDELELVGTNVSDAGLLYIAQRKDLKQVNLRQTKVTGSGVAMLQAELPNCRIIWP